MALFLEFPATPWAGAGGIGKPCLVQLWWQDHLAVMVILRPSLARKIMGWALLALGVLGLVLPFLQGFLFLAFGVFTLRDQHVWAARRWAWVAGRWPDMVGKLEAMEDRMMARFRRMAARFLPRR